MQNYLKLSIAMIPNKIEKLKELARQVGAGTENTKNIGIAVISPNESHTNHSIITESELVQNIQQSLQTLSMIEACKISARNCGAAIASAIAAAISAGISYVVAKRKE